MDTLALEALVGVVVLEDMVLVLGLDMDLVLDTGLSVHLHLHDML